MFFRWLKRYMPRGLYGRAILILLLPVVSLQLIVSVVFIQRHFEGVTELMTASVVRELDFLQEQIAFAPTVEDRRNVALGLAQALNFDLTLDPPTEPLTDARPFYDLSGRVVVQQLRARLEGVGAVDLSQYGRVTLEMSTAAGQVHISFDRIRVSASNPHQLIVIMVLMGAFMTLIAYFFLRNQLRPIKRMAAAAAEYGKGRIVPFTPTGAIEVRAAGQAFLEMRARIERQVQSRSLMLSGISHDLRTPLTRLRLGLSMVDDAEAEPMIRDVEDMERLIAAFLDYARQDAADSPVPTNPAELLAQVIADAERSGQAVKCGDVSGLEAGELVALRPLAMRRALENLVGNGLRYGSHVRLSLLATDRTIRFRVEDDGPGIPPQSRDEAMRPFTRLDPARNQNRGSGVGLGLAIVSDLARLHGGSLRLSESEEMGGLCADIVIAR